MPILASALIGLIFGCGILISGMSNPAKVVNFFDIAGAWDPSLAFVMGGGLLVNLVGYRIAFRRTAPILMPSFSLPAVTRVDAALVGGSAVFGIGWGLSGVCPGGLIPVLAVGGSGPLLFLAGLLAGIAAARFARARFLTPAA